MAGAHEGLGFHFVAPLFEVFKGRIAQERDTGAVAGNDGTGGLGFTAAGGIVAAGDGVLDHGVGDDQGDVGWDGGEAEAEVAAVEEEGVILFAVGGDELIHDAAVGAHELVLDTLAESRKNRTGITGADER